MVFEREVVIGSDCPRLFLDIYLSAFLKYLPTNPDFTTSFPVIYIYDIAGKQIIADISSFIIVILVTEARVCNLSLSYSVIVCFRVMDWRSVWRSSVGDVADDEYLSPITASLTFFTINIFTGILLRGLNKAMTPSFLQEYVADFLSTMEMCAYFFENNFVKANYGNAGLFIAVVLQGFIVNRTFGDSIDNPVKVLGQYMTGSCSVLKAIMKIAIMALAGVASYRFARMVWALDLISDHHARYYETECATDLKVTLLWGILVELSATLADAWLGKQTVSKFSFLDEFIKCANGALMIIAGEPKAKSINSNSLIDINVSCII